MLTRYGRQEHLPYSLSRWTDVPIVKWDWFMQQVRQGYFIGIDPKTGFPDRWSLVPEETLGLIFWTKDPTNLLNSPLFKIGYQIQLHHTITGWHEAEPRAPETKQALKTLERAVQLLGPHMVRWRFSPIPAVPDVLDRFRYMVKGAQDAGLQEVYCSFLQQSDLVAEARSLQDRRDILTSMREEAQKVGIAVVLCREDQALYGQQESEWLRTGVCAPPETFKVEGQVAKTPVEGCGCGLAVDPFTRNEACIGCHYCYVVDPSAGKVRNTTKRSLPVIS